MIRLFDASTWVGRWPFRPIGCTLAGLESRLRAHGIEGACVAPAAAVLAPDPVVESLRLCRLVARRRTGFRWVSAAVVDPSLADWREGALRCLKAGAGCLKVAPNYHMYPAGPGGRVVGEAAWVAAAADAGGRALAELCRLAAERGVPVAVQVRMQDERAHHPLMRVPGVPGAEVAALAAEHPETRFVACGCYLAELGALAPAANVWAEISFVEGSDTLADAAARFPAQRLLFGSHTPLHYTAAACAKVAAATVAAEVRTMVAEGNAQWLWGER